MVRLVFIFSFLIISNCLNAQITISRDSSSTFQYNNGWVREGFGHASVRYCNGAKCNGSIIDTLQNGQVVHKGFYVNGQLHGIVFDYFDNGQLWMFGQLDTGKRVGIWIHYYESGNIESELTYTKKSKSPLNSKHYFENGKVHWVSNRDTINHTLTEFVFNEKGDTVSAHIPIDIEKRIYHLWKKNDSGKLIEDGLYQDDVLNLKWKKIGVWKWYDENGILIRTEEY